MHDVPISPRQEKRPMAIVEPIGSHGGAHYYDDNQARALVEHGHRVTLYSMPASTDIGAPYTKYNTFRNIFGKSPKIIRGLRQLRDLTALTLHARFTGTKVYLFQLFKLDVFELFGLVFAKSLGMKTMAVIHDVSRLDKTGSWSALPAIARICDLLIVHNAFSEQTLRAELKGQNASIAVIPSGNLIRQFPHPPSKQDARHRLGLRLDQLILLFFGNPRREKGLHVLLQAMRRFKDDDRLQLVVAGKMNPSEEREYRGFVESHGLQARVRLDIGHVDDAMVGYYYRMCDALALPYSRIYESGVALMAMSLERPVITSDLPPLREVVGDDQRGILFEMGNADALGDRIAEVLNDPERLERLAANAARYAAEDRDWSVTGRMLSEAAQRL
jgi:glycosyltransferase involved in cell wall biosynthesis